MLVIAISKTCQFPTYIGTDHKPPLVTNSSTSPQSRICSFILGTYAPGLILLLPVTGLVALAVPKTSGRSATF